MAGIGTVAIVVAVFSIVTIEDKLHSCSGEDTIGGAKSDCGSCTDLGFSR
jgi:hypothetical protein